MKHKHQSLRSPLALVMLVVLSGSPPALAGRFIGPETQVAPGYVIGPAAFHQNGVAMAWGEGDYLLAWTDARDSSFDLVFIPFLPKIFGARVASDGTVLDPVGRPINAADAMKGWVSLAWGGERYLAVWSDMTKAADDDLYFTLVTSNGVPLSSEGLVLCNTSGVQNDSAVTAGGSDYLVVWTDKRDDAGDIYAARITSNGTVVDSNGVAFYQGAGEQAHPAVAWSGAEYLIVWEHEPDSWGDIYGMLYDPSGPSGAPAFPICTTNGHQGRPSVTWDGSSFLVGWQDDRAGNWDVYAARVAGNGLVLDPDGFPVAVTGEDELRPAVASDAGGTGLVAYQRGTGGAWDVLGALLDTSGPLILDTFPICDEPGNQVEPRGDFNGSEYLVAWQDEPSGPFDYNVYAARITAGGTVLDPGGFQVSSAAQHRQRARAGFDGNQYLVVWTEWDAEPAGAPGGYLEPGIAGARLDADGATIDTNAITVTDLASREWFSDVATTPAGSLVIWQDERNYASTGGDIYGAWVDASGTVMPPGGQPICTNGGDQALASVGWDGGNNFLIAYVEQDAPGGDDIWGLVFHADGSPIVGPFPICQADRHQLVPRVAFDGANFMVVWEDQRRTIPPPGGHGESDIYAARVTPDGVVLDPVYPGGFPVAEADVEETAPQIAWNGANYLVVYAHVDDPNAADVYGVRVAPDGTADVPFPIAENLSLYPLVGLEPDVSWDGLVHAVTYPDYPELCIVRVGPDPGDPPTAPICFEPADGGRRPRVCHGPGLRHLLMYESLLLDPPYGSYRILSRQFESYTKGDYDDDGDIDLDDFAYFPGCMTGPDGGPVADGCEPFDFEPDDDVDLADFSGFQVAFTGPG